MKTRIDIKLTKKEFEDLLFDHFALRCGNKHTLLNFYRWTDGHADISIESEPPPYPVPVPVISAAERADVNAAVANALATDAGGEAPPTLWTPDPPFIHTTEVNEEEPPPARDYISGYYPHLPEDSPAILGEGGMLCKCKNYWVYAAYGWLDAYGQLHEKAQCESFPAAADATAALSASSTGEHGTVEADDDIPF